MALPQYSIKLSHTVRLPRTCLLFSTVSVQSDCSVPAFYCLPFPYSRTSTYLLVIVYHFRTVGLFCICFLLSTVSVQSDCSVPAFFCLLFPYSRTVPYLLVIVYPFRTVGPFRTCIVYCFRTVGLFRTCFLLSTVSVQSDCYVAAFYCLPFADSRTDLYMEE